MGRTVVGSDPAYPGEYRQGGEDKTREEEEEERAEGAVDVELVPRDPVRLFVVLRM